MRFDSYGCIRLRSQASNQKSQWVKKGAETTGGNDPKRRHDGILAKQQKEDEQELSHHQIIDMSPDNVGTLDEVTGQYAVGKKQRDAQHPGDAQRDGQAEYGKR
jgi:hypothetical protein